jgi:hypothetical protein
MIPPSGFEHHSQPLLPLRHFLIRLARSSGIAFALVGCSLALGMTGYHWLEHLSWTDSFLNASMLLGGMGPVNPPISTAGKLFAGCYALYCGLIVLIATGVILTPVAHRILHHFHSGKPVHPSTTSPLHP